MLNPSHCPRVVHASLASPAHPRKPNVRTPHPAPRAKKRIDGFSIKGSPTQHSKRLAHTTRPAGFLLPSAVIQPNKNPFSLA